MMSRRHRSVVLGCSLGLAVLECAAAHGQVSAGLRGRVEDASGAAIGGARVELVGEATGVRLYAVASTEGEFLFPNLTPGMYEVDVTATGFQTLARKGVTVSVGQTASVEMPLSVGGEATSMTVTADAPLLQVTESDIETHVPGAQVVGLPLNSRNFINLAQLAPGVELPPGQVLPRINGGRPRTNEYLFDGISALQPEPGQVAFFPIIDDIAEFTIEADNVPAEFGRFNGGVVNVATRAGTDALHGSLYEFFRNEDLNALNYFAVPGARKPEYRRNLFGATLGGPVLRDRIFFFGDYQGIKALIGKPITSTIPTRAERQGIFTGVAKIYDPTQTGVVAGKTIRPEFVNDVITAPLDSAALALLARLPQPTNANAANNYVRTANDADHQNQFDVRMDAALGLHDRGFGRYSYFSDVEQPITALPDGSGPTAGAVIGTGNVAGLSHVLGQQAVVDETHTFSATMVNDFRLGYTRRGNTTGGPQLAGTASAVLGIPGIPTNAAFNNALPLFTFTGFQQLGPPASTFSQYQTAVWQGVDTATLVHGRHALKVGADVRFYELNAVSPPNPTGAFAFTTTGTNTQNAAGMTSGGNAFASFLLGQVDTFSIDLQRSKLRPRAHIQEYFAQDDWRATQRLTLNVGARWTLHSPSVEKNNQGAVFNLATQLLDYAGAAGNSRSARMLHFGNVAPRLGLTYLMTPKTVVRAGFGIVFIDQSGITTPFTLPQFPFIQNVQQKTGDGLAAAFQLSSGPTVAPIALTPNAGLGQSVYTAKRTAGSGYVEQWNLGFERAVTNNLSVDVAYVGTHIVHVGIPDANINQLTAAQLAAGAANPASLTAQVANPYYGVVPASSPLGGKTVAAAQLLKPFPEFQNVAFYRNNSGTANYNALEVKVEERPVHGLYLLMAYTYSRLIDDASAVFSSTVLSSPNSNSLIAADTYRPYLERDVSSGDMPNVTTAGVTYQLPGRSRLLGGWAVNGLMTLQSGMPVPVTQANNLNSFAGVALQRPRLVTDPQLHGDARSPLKFFNTAAFATAAQFTFGNASRNPVRGPAFRDVDLAFVKHTRLFEKAELEFRAEVFDITNTPAFAQPNGSFGSAAFGTITATTTDPRVVQFGLRLSL
jgi:hypothetical protein